MTLLLHNNYCFYFQNIWKQTDCGYGKTNFCLKDPCEKIYWTATNIVEFTEDLAKSIVNITPGNDTLILGFGMFSDQMEVIEEYFVYRFPNFMADVGGNLGLLLGISILSMFQHVRKWFAESNFKRQRT